MVEQGGSDRQDRHRSKRQPARKPTGGRWDLPKSMLVARRLNRPDPESHTNLEKSSEDDACDTTPRAACCSLAWITRALHTGLCSRLSKHSYLLCLPGWSGPSKFIRSPCRIPSGSPEGGARRRPTTGRSRVAASKTNREGWLGQRYQTDSPAGDAGAIAETSPDAG